ncbi:MAG: histidine phosphatase family protein [Anaerolineae bacterium]|jgi:broad specificity phosphatase PhoE
MTTQILLIRHGQTALNAENRIRGQADVPLDTTGRWQARVTGNYVADRWPLAAVYSSPLLRSCQTAEAIASAQGLAAQPLDGLLDMSFGEWEGLTITEVKDRWPALARAWYEEPHTVEFPSGESLSVVRERSTAALDAVAVRHEGETIALVAHAVVNRVLLCAVLGIDIEHFWWLGQGTCAINLIKWDGEQYRLMMMNDTSHLWRAEAV